MSALARGWILLGRWQRRARRARPTGATALDAWMARNVRGRSFADIGCMWSIDGRRAFLAEELGATRVTAFDAMEASPTFLAEHQRRESAVRFVRGDLHDPATVQQIGRHDVVLGNGVVYHSPNPYLLVAHLGRLTGDLLLLGSRTIPEIPGMHQAAIFLPRLADGQRRAHASAHKQDVVVGVTHPFDHAPEMAYANTWWAITPSALEAMVETAGLEVVERLATDGEPFSTHLVARTARAG